MSVNHFLKIFLNIYLIFEWMNFEMNFSFFQGWFPSCEREEARQIAKVRLFEKYEFNKEGSMMYGPASRKGTCQDQPASIHRYCIRNITRWRKWTWCTGCQNVSRDVRCCFHVTNKIVRNFLLNLRRVENTRCWISSLIEQSIILFLLRSVKSHEDIIYGEKNLMLIKFNPHFLRQIISYARYFIKPFIHRFLKKVF